jgi:hypothetical protein
VVVVLVGEQHVIHPHSPCIEPCRDTFRRINQKVSVGSFYQITVGLGIAAAVTSDFHGMMGCAED